MAASSQSDEEIADNIDGKICKLGELVSMLEQQSSLDLQ